MPDPYLFSIHNLLWLLFLLLLLRHFYRRLTTLRKATSWLITQGTITHLSWSNDYQSFWPTITYRYSLIDNQFTSDYLFLDTTFNTPYSPAARQVAYQAAMAYQNNQTIDVYYNPANPCQAALNIDVPLKLKIIIIVIAGLIIVHSGFLLWHIRWYWNALIGWG